MYGLVCQYQCLCFFDLDGKGAESQGGVPHLRLGHHSFRAVDLTQLHSVTWPKTKQQNFGGG